jgi:hypothetical protein
MRLREVVLDYIAETKLFEMAFERKVAVNKSRHLQNQISRHLVKVYMYQDSEYVNHWCNELNTWLNDIQDNIVRGNNRPLDFDTLMKILLIEPMESVAEVQNLMNRVYREYKDLKIDQPDAAVVHKNIHLIVPKICDTISNSRFQDIQTLLRTENE